MHWRPMFLRVRGSSPFPGCCQTSPIIAEGCLVEAWVSSTTLARLVQWVCNDNPPLAHQLSQLCELERGLVRLPAICQPALTRGELVLFKSVFLVSSETCVQAGERGVVVRSPDPVTGEVQLFMDSYRRSLDATSNTIYLMPFGCDACDHLADLEATTSDNLNAIADSYLTLGGCQQSPGV